MVWNLPSADDISSWAGKVNPRRWVERWEGQQGGEMRQRLSAQSEVLKSGSQIDRQWRNRRIIIMTEIMVKWVWWDVMTPRVNGASWCTSPMSHWHCPTHTRGLRIKVSSPFLFLNHSGLDSSVWTVETAVDKTISLLLFWRFQLQWKCMRNLLTLSYETSS